MLKTLIFFQALVCRESRKEEVLTTRVAASYSNSFYGGLYSPWIESCEGEIFCTRSDLPRGPNTLL